MGQIRSYQSDSGSSERYIIKFCLETANKCTFLARKIASTIEARTVISVPVAVGKLKKDFKIRIRVRDRLRREWLQCHDWPFFIVSSKSRLMTYLLVYRKVLPTFNFFRNLFG